MADGDRRNNFADQSKTSVIWEAYAGVAVKDPLIDCSEDKISLAQYSRVNSNNQSEMT